MKKTDMQLKLDIEEELRWDPKVNAARIGVTVEKGAVSLLGSVDTYPEKWAAQDATKRVTGVRTVAHDLTVKVLEGHKRSDSDIAVATQSVLTWNVLVPRAVTATVHNGAVTLAGEVSGNYQRDAAERAVRHLTGVVAVRNSITLERGPAAAQVKEKVQAALQRQAMSDVNSIHIETSGGKVTLTGHASSWQSIEDAANAAWAAPGVTEVIDQVKMSMTLGAPSLQPG
jgi:osmotically-inducible protein OsmY